MKLLEKNEIQAQKSAQIKLEIDDGMRLNRKIGELRETRLKEEADLEKFRSETVRAVTESIELLNLEKHRVQAEIHALSRERAALLEPLDGEWFKVRNKADELEALEIRLSEKESALNSEIEDVQSRKKELIRLSDRIESQSQYLRKLKSEAESAVALSRDEQRMLSDSQSRYEKFIGSRFAKIGEREKSLLELEERIRSQREAADERERFLNERERQINDKYLTLLRTTNRTKND